MVESSRLQVVGVGAGAGARAGGFAHRRRGGVGIRCALAILIAGAAYGAPEASGPGVRPIAPADMLAGWTPRGLDRTVSKPIAFFEPFEAMSPGEWRSLIDGGEVWALVGRSLDGDLAMVVQYGSCGADCTAAPQLTLLFRKHAPVRGRSDRAVAPFTVSVDGGPAYGQNAVTYPGELAETPSALVSIGVENDAYGIADYGGGCFTVEDRCVDESFLPAFRTGRSSLKVSVPVAGGRAQVFNFDLGGQPFRALPDRAAR